MRRTAFVARGSDVTRVSIRVCAPRAPVCLWAALAIPRYGMEQSLRAKAIDAFEFEYTCLLYTSPSPRDS